MRDLVIGIGGAAGDGLARSGDVLAITCTREGLHVYAYNSYQSVIRGGHIWLTVRVAEDKVRSHGDRLDLLIALNQDTLERHVPEVVEGGAVLFNGDRLACPEELLGKGVSAMPVPVKELTAPLGKVPPVMQNSVLVGVASRLLGLDHSVMEEVIRDLFGGKSVEVTDQNVAAARAGHDHAGQRFPAFHTGWHPSGTARPFITGNEAMALGAIAAGCRFYSAYPMTPVSNILHYLAAHGPRFGIVVKQCEDELAVINTAIGAGYAGARAMCATSGGGFALMTEAIGLAGMLEVPVVIVEGQRGGPSTGVPTKTEQGDLNQVYGASQGDYPRVILAPTDVADAFRAIVDAFNLAERYQIPVLVISDLRLAEHHETVERDQLAWEVPIDRGECVDEVSPGARYLRYRLTPSGVSPRALPGTPGAIHTAASDEHDEQGIVVSDVFTSPPVRRKMHEKRMRKMVAIARELPPPERYGPDQSDVLLMGWGATDGAIHEAVDLLTERGISAAQLQVRYLLPFPVEPVRAAIQRTRQVFVVEENLSGQFARLVRAETGWQAKHKVLKYDGEPFTPGDIANHVEAWLKGEAPDLSLTEAEARETAYHFIRSQLHDGMRPVDATRVEGDGYGEPAWEVRLADRQDGSPGGELVIGAETGATLAWRPAAEKAREASHGHT